MEKKRWRKPKTILLVRGKPEEAILAACKAWTTGPGGIYTGCHTPAPETGFGCVDCFTIAST